MKYLLDTHVLLWTLFETSKLSQTAKELIQSPQKPVFVSVVSFWEIAIKYGLGKIKFEQFTPEDIPLMCGQMKLELMELNPEICISYHQLPIGIHQDPFDRMLIWQAKCLNLTLISKDERIGQYSIHGIKVVW